MLLIGFDHPEHWFGGFGDRVVGIINIRLIARLLNEEFKITWTKENVKKYIDYSKYDIGDNLVDVDITFNYIDSSRLKENVAHVYSYYLKNKGKNIKFWLNQYLSKHLYSYTFLADRNYHTDIIEEYKLLYIDILKPTEYTANKINELIDDSDIIIGIQIRCGADAKLSNNICKSEVDRHKGVYMSPPWRHISQTQKLDNEFNDIFKKIKMKCDTKYKSYKIFITSDYMFDSEMDLFRLASNAWNSENLLYLKEPPQHLDRKPIGDFSKFYIDNYILSQKVTELYFSSWSNYGKIAALSCNHDDIYDIIDIYTKIEKKKLLP